jgi:hypothetical protein
MGKFLKKIKSMFSRKYSMTIMDENWDVLKNNLKFSFLPQKDDFIFLEEFNEYFTVINTVHYINKKHGIFLIVKKFSQKKLHFE